MATASQATGAVLATVANTAQSISSAVNTLNDGITMLHNYVSNIKEEQEDNYVLTSEYRETRMLNTITKQITEEQEEIDTYLDKNPRRKEVFDTTYAQLKSKLDAHKGRTETK